MRELRIGLVLYGGVALAVYINGIVTEVWHALRASRARGGGARPGGTAGVYFDLLERLEGIEGAGRLRIVVDAVSGTSAGGVNGGALAKAVVDGGDASVLSGVWIDDADISKLAAQPGKAPWLVRTALWGLSRFSRIASLRARIEALPGLTWEWVRDTAYALATSKDGAFTPLNGGYFTRMIAKTFKDMDEAGDGMPLLPDRGTFDLALTRTDVHGWPRHLPLSAAFHPAAVYERTHAHAMVFRRRASGGRLDDDFGLTYACRTTAGFPIAFPPADLATVAADYSDVRPGDAVPPPYVFGRRHLREHGLAGFPGESAWMIDGGVLDNKPFSYVARAIEDKPADHQVYRVVAYVEPDPEGEVKPSAEGRPPALAMLKHLYGLMRHEPILGDLRELYARNEKVQRIRDIRAAAMADAVAAARMAGSAAGLAWPPALPDLDLWREVANRAVATARGAGYSGYVMLKARRAASVAAAAICGALEYPYDARHGYFVRQLVRDWLERRGALVAPVYVDGEGYAMSPQQRELLDAFDLPFRLRRVRALVQVVNRGYAAGPDGPAATPQERQQLDDCKRALSDIAFGYEAAFQDAAGLSERIIAALKAGDGAALDLTVGEAVSDPAAAIARFNAELSSSYEALIAMFSASGNEQNARIAEAIGLLPPGVREKAAQELVAFPFIDLTIFPMMDAAEVGDLIKIEAMRFSPHDAAFLSDRKDRLMSRDLGAFKGFLERRARENDVMWGRLDGVDRMVELILAAATEGGGVSADLAALRREFTRRGMQVVLDEEAVRPGSTIADLIAPLQATLATR